MKALTKRDMAYHKAWLYFSSDLLELPHYNPEEEPGSSEGKEIWLLHC